jgi:hypothetical protein
MAFGKNVKYGSVTLDFILACAKILDLNPKDDKTLRIVLHRIGFQVSVLNEETGEYVPCKIDRMNNVNVRCADKPYMFRKTTVFSGRLRDERDFPFVGIYDKVDVLDVDSAIGAAMVNSLSFDIPSVEKVNTRKYTKREDRSDVVVMDLPEFGDTDDIFNLVKGA